MRKIVKIKFNFLFGLLISSSPSDYLLNHFLYDKKLILRGVYNKTSKNKTLGRYEMNSNVFLEYKFMSPS